MRKSTRRTVRDPMACITKRMPLGDDQTRDIGIAYHISLQSMLNGHGTEQSWNTVACSLNVSIILAEAGIEPSSLPTIKIAQEALLRVRERGRRIGKWVFDGDGIRVILTAINIHDEQIRRATRTQITSALQEIHRRIENGDIH